MKEAHRLAGSGARDGLPLRSEVLLAAVLKGVTVRDREKFTEDLAEVFSARSEAHGLRAFWELVVRWERLYPSVVQSLERRIGVSGCA